jgi:tetratricopeptide (TPR) repeat protein
MAGFSTHTIVADDPAVNFFQEWMQARVDTRPTPQQRAETVKARLRQVLTEIDLFQAGLLFYYAGNYEKAIPAFETFRHVFDSREVYHNLATSHHQLALQVYGLRQEAAQRMPFRLSVAIDPETRARRVRLMRYVSRSADGLDTRLRHHLDSALTFYRAALARDPVYMPAVNNLGAALIVRSVLYDTPADLHAAAATLLQVPADSRSAATLNNLGVVYWHLGDREQALMSWRAAQQLAPAYAPVLFNLGEQAHQAHRAEEAQQYWQQYVQVEPFSGYTTKLLQRMPSVGPSPLPVSTGLRHAEHVKGVHVGDFESDRIQDWGTPHQRQLSLSDEVFTASQYPQQVWTLSQGKSILLILVQAGYTGTSAGGIAIGDTADAVHRRYGEPSRIQEMPHGQSWCYDASGIAFHLHQGQVIAWLLYDA